MSSLMTSVLGAAPGGIVTAGLLASGPLVGVLALAVGGVVGVVLVGVFSPATCGTELTSDSLPTAMVLEFEEPQPAIRATRPRVATMEPMRARECLEECEGVKFITGASLTHQG